MAKSSKPKVQFLRRGNSCFVRIVWKSRFVEVIRLSVAGYERATRKGRAILTKTTERGTFEGDLSMVLEFAATIDTFADEFRRHEVMK